MRNFIILTLIVIGCSKKSEEQVKTKFAIAGTINTVYGYSDTLAGALIRIKDITNNLYVNDAIVKINNNQVQYSSSALGYFTLLSYHKNDSFKVEISFSNYNFNILCKTNNLDSVRISLNKDSVIKGENIIISWNYFGEPSGSNMILLKKQGSLEFSFGSGYIPISDTSYILNTSVLDTFKYDLLFISGNFCIINELEPYPNFPNSLIFVGRSANKIIQIR